MNTFSNTRDSAAVSVPDLALQALCDWRDRRDEKAARRLVSQLSPLMRGIALRALRCPWMAEDALQTAWLLAYAQGCGGIDGPGPGGGGLWV